MTILARGRYVARRAATPADLASALRLRAACFRGDPSRDDSDRFDALCDHVLIEDREAVPVGCFRLLTLPADDIGQSYSAQFYGLDRLAGMSGKVMEVGRFCIAPGRTDPDILRVAWGALTRVVDRRGVGLLFGCTSFPGIEAKRYRAAFARLRDRHLAPARDRPGVKARETVIFAASTPEDGPENGPENGQADALKLMPPLLRAYLGMGGWVSDHAVVDRDMNTLHVFTGLEIARIPLSRQRQLRALSQ